MRPELLEQFNKGCEDVLPPAQQLAWSAEVHMAQSCTKMGLGCCFKLELLWGTCQQVRVNNTNMRPFMNTSSAGRGRGYIRLYFCAHYFCPKKKMFTFSQAHSHALTNATRRHEYFRGLSRLLPVPGVLVSFLELRFLGKMALLALGGRPQPLKKPSQSQKGHFYK